MEKSGCKAVVQHSRLLGEREPTHRSALAPRGGWADGSDGIGDSRVDLDRSGCAAAGVPATGAGGSFRRQAEGRSVHGLASKAAGGKRYVETADPRVALRAVSMKTPGLPGCRASYRTLRTNLPLHVNASARPQCLPMPKSNLSSWSFRVAMPGSVADHFSEQLPLENATMAGIDSSSA